MSETATDKLDPAATDETSNKAQDGARKRRDPNEPAAVIGLGASAGGVVVLQQFFADIPVNSGLAFVVVMHLSPDLRQPSRRRDSDTRQHARYSGERTGAGAAQPRLCNSAEQADRIRGWHAWT